MEEIFICEQWKSEDLLALLDNEKEGEVPVERTSDQSRYSSSSPLMVARQDGRELSGGKGRDRIAVIVARSSSKWNVRGTNSEKIQVILTRLDQN